MSRWSTDRTIRWNTTRMSSNFLGGWTKALTRTNPTPLHRGRARREPRRAARASTRVSFRTSARRSRSRLQQLRTRARSTQLPSSRSWRSTATSARRRPEGLDAFCWPTLPSGLPQDQRRAKEGSLGAFRTGIHGSAGQRVPRPRARPQTAAASRHLRRCGFPLFARLPPELAAGPHPSPCSSKLAEQDGRTHSPAVSTRGLVPDQYEERSFLAARGPWRPFSIYVTRIDERERRSFEMEPSRNVVPDMRCRISAHLGFLPLRVSPAHCL